MKKKIIGEIAELKGSIGKAEYASWWLIRIMLLCGIFYKISQNGESFTIMLMWFNFLALFSIPLLKFVSIKKLIFSKIPFRVQTYINIFVFFGSFLGHAVNVYRFYADFDKFLHVISGSLVVFFGIRNTDSCKKQ